MTSDDYRPVAILSRAGVRPGPQRTIQHTKLQSPAVALQKLREDKAAWVRPEDAEAVLAAWRAEVTHAETLPDWAREATPATTAQ